MSEVDIHPSAVVETGAVIGDDVKIGPFSVIGSDVVLGNGVEIIGSASVAGRTEVGAGTRIFPYSSIGHQPQDLKFAGEPSELKIGENCTIRENVTINPGTRGGGMLTKIGNNCLLMASVHVAHDCIIGNNVIIANYGGIAGHCRIDDFVTIGGMTVMHQFVRVGKHAFVGASSMVDRDVIPFGMALGNRAKLAGLNLVGLKRRTFSRLDIHGLRTAYKLIFSDDLTLEQRVAEAKRTHSDNALVQDLIVFINEDSERSLCLPRNGSCE